MSTTINAPSGQPLQQQPGEFTGSAPAHLVTWQNKRIPPPSPLYVDVDDQLQVGAASSQGNEVVTINYRLLRAADGVIMRGQFTVAPLSTRAVVTQKQQLAEGFLLSVSCKAAVASTRGQTFVRLFIGAGPYGAGEPSYMLMSDYVTTAMAPAFPNGRQLAPSEGPGFIRNVVLGVQPAGSDFALATPVNARWRLISLLAALQTAAAGSARQLQFQVGSSGNLLWNRYLPGTQPVSTEYTYNLSPLDLDSVTVVGTAGTVVTPLAPGLVLFSNDVIISITGGIQPLDQWINVNAKVEEWLDNV
jgi:hypothetical protein